MSNHQASEQMLGYLYQVRCALKLLLENDNSDFHKIPGARPLVLNCKRKMNKI